MSDLIDREYAIKRFCEDGTYLERHGIQMMSLCEAKQRAVDLIESFPSAQSVNYGSTKTDSSSQLKLNNDLINRKDAFDALEGVDWYHFNDTTGKLVHGSTSDMESWYKVDDVRKAIDQLPSAQPQRKKGKWNRISGRLGNEVECSNCHDVFWIWMNNYSYCPRCGAEMGDESDE